MSKNCLVCGKEAHSVSFDAQKDEYTVVCPTCGRFTITDRALESIDLDHLASYLYYHAIFDESKNSFHTYFYVCYGSKKDADYWVVTYDMVENWYPKTFAEKVDLFLLLLEEKSNYMGYDVLFSTEQMLSACFVKRKITGKWEARADSEREWQCVYFLNYLRDCDYIEEYNHETQICLAPSGYQRVDELQKNNSKSKEVFVSMAFNDGTKQTREAIRDGIIDAGYSPEFIDEIIHNHQIMPEMFRLIRECRFLIMDVSDPNYGAYYEAGYALGLGKEVIISCKEEVFTKKYETEEEKRLEKYMKPHFDIAQKQLLIWKDYEDLTHKLSEWIKSIIG